jgi:uncharacterized protein YndB with AHSA1/START domain
MTTTQTPPESANQDFVISRTFNAPRDLVFKVWSDPTHTQHWFGPRGFTTPVCRQDLRPGGTLHYCMRSAEGHEMWGKFVYREVNPPERLVYVNSFSNAEGGLTRHPMSPTWPLEMLSTITFDEEGGQTKVAVRWSVLPSATPEECKTFNEGLGGMQHGWSGTFDQLDAYLAELAKK